MTRSVHRGRGPRHTRPKSGASARRPTDNKDHVDPDAIPTAIIPIPDKSRPSPEMVRDAIYTAAFHAFDNIDPQGNVVTALHRPYRIFLGKDYAFITTAGPLTGHLPIFDPPWYKDHLCILLHGQRCPI